ncbi:histidinol dehydrogenase [bacterium]|nr:histidinol dehydrogenase [bacterium]NIN93125.1 histidinol dehydrogenase [bacterium]NIO18074.1 histidinol dehydrogenase [bacterium]NIO74059.1 histidinol dehydrogenase [bacterium]
MKTVEKRVREIIERVKNQGDKALLFYTRKYDGLSLKPAELRVKKAEIDRAFQMVGLSFIRVIEKAKKNIEKFHLGEYRQITRKNRQFSTGTSKGIRFVELWRAVERVGVYVPGGKFAYPSSVLMTIVPAKVAGVGRIAVVSPPGKLNSEVLVAARICGVEEIYRVGGAQAIAAFAYGTRTIPKVDKIVGPGNVYVTTAKRLLFGDVGIDMLAGPSEILIIADGNANPDYIVSDLLAQVEHGGGASARLITTSKRIKNIVKRKVKRKGVHLVWVESIKEAVRLANEFAPEHLEILLEKPERILPEIKNAGEIFLGKWSPVAVGDYYAGPSHVLPTGGSARFCSGLSVKDFLKRMVVVACSERGLRSSAQDIINFAKAEGLGSHAESIKVRLKK